MFDAKEARKRAIHGQVEKQLVDLGYIVHTLDLNNSIYSEFYIEY